MNEGQVDNLSVRPETALISNRFCVYLSGASGAERSALPIGQSLARTFGEKNVLSLPSIASVDADKRYPFKRSYQQIAGKLIEQIDQGKKATVIGFSGGAVELVDLVKALVEKNNNPNYWKDNLDVIIMGAPGIFRGAKQFIDHMKQFRIYINDFFAGGMAAGLDSLYLHPPATEQISDTRLALLIRKFYPTQSNIIEGPKQILPDKPTTKLTEEQLNQLHNIDQQLSNVDNFDQFKALLNQRGIIMSPQLKEKFDIFVPERRLHPSLLKYAKLCAQELLGFAKMFKSITTGQVLKTIEQLHQMEVDISLIVPEYDPIFPSHKAAHSEYILELSGKEPQEAIIAFLAYSSHQSWVMNPDTLTAAVKLKYQQ